MRLIKNGKFWTVFGANGCLFMSINMNEALEKIEELGGKAWANNIKMSA